MKISFTAVGVVACSLLPLADGFQVAHPLNSGLAHATIRLQSTPTAGPNSGDDSEKSKDNKAEDEKVEESAAMKWAAEQKEELEKEKAELKQKAEELSSDKKKYVIIGAGWAGWGAAKAICESGIDAEVTIIDALPDPTGNTPYLSSTGKPVEAGTRGFWKDYPNICELLAELGIEVRTM